MNRYRFIGALLLATALIASTAFGQTAVIHDDAGMLSSIDTQKIEGYAKQMPFDVHVLTRKNITKSQLETAVNGSIRSNTVAIGIEMPHGFIVMKYGAATMIPQGAATSLALQRNGYSMFGAGQWGEGIGAILAATRAAAQNAAIGAPQAQNYAPPAPNYYPPQRAAVPMQPLAPVDPVSSGFPWGWALISLSLLGLVGWGFFKNKKPTKKYADNPTPTAENYRQKYTYNPLAVDEDYSGAATRSDFVPPVKAPVTSQSPAPRHPRSWQPAPVVVSAPAPVIIHEHHDSGGSDLAAGIMIGSMMNREPPAREERRYDFEPSTPQRKRREVPIDDAVESFTPSESFRTPDPEPVIESFRDSEPSAVESFIDSSSSAVESFSDAGDSAVESFLS